MEFLPLDTRTGKVRGTSSRAGTAPKPIDFSEVFVIGLTGPGPGGSNIGGITRLASGQTHVVVTFATPQPDPDWLLLSCSVLNTTDPTPLNLWPGTMTSKTAAGFQLELNGAADSNNYYLHWAIAGQAELPPPPPSGDTTAPTDPTGLTATFIATPPDTTPPSTPSGLVATLIGLG